MSDRLCISSNASIQTFISAVDLMSCCSFCGDQCNGGYPDEALYHFTYTGIVTGSGYIENSLCKPYPVAPCYKDPVTKDRICPKEPSNIRCKKECQSTYVDEKYPNDKYFGKTVKHYNRNNDAAIAELLGRTF
jgi:cathepsin B